MTAAVKSSTSAPVAANKLLSLQRSAASLWTAAGHSRPLAMRSRGTGGCRAVQRGQPMRRALDRPGYWISLPGFDVHTLR